MIDWSDIFYYRDGKLYNATTRNNRAKQGALAGNVDVNGMNRMSYKGKRYSASRIVWTMFNGEIPEGMIVRHLDGDPGNDKIDNLELAVHGTCNPLFHPKHGLSRSPVYKTWFNVKDQVDVTLEEYTELYNSKPSGTNLHPVNGKLVYMAVSDCVRSGKLRKNNTSGYVDVYLDRRRDKWYWQLVVEGKTEGKTGFDTREDAAWDRERWIVENGVVAKLNFLRSA